jgi:phage shock protein PspC (stress-responsive transcriptional regulator)
MRDWFRSHGLVRPRRGRVFAGVCRGIANKLGTSAWVVRLVAIVSIVLPGPQVLAYLILWVLMPSDR